MSNDLILFRRNSTTGYLIAVQTQVPHGACVRVLEATDFLNS